MSQEVAKDEVLVRGVFSSKEANSAQRHSSIPYTIFMERVGTKEISVDIFSRTTPDAAAAVAREVAENRGENRKFYGWGKITVEHATKNGRLVSPSPIDGNEHHADIILPSAADSITREEQFYHAQELARLSHWQPPPD